MFVHTFYVCLYFYSKSLYLDCIKKYIMVKMRKTTQYALDVDSSYESIHQN